MYMTQHTTTTTTAWRWAYAGFEGGSGCGHRHRTRSAAAACARRQAGNATCVTLAWGDDTGDTGQIVAGT